LGSTVRIKIVGANEGDIPEHYRHSNIDLLGYSDAGTVAELFRTSDAMICPVENDYGVKFKSLEALSYGIPLIASKQTLLGLPYLSWSPFIELDKPDAAASFIDYIISDPGGLKDLAALQQEAQSSFIASQQGIWSRIMAPLLGS
jgi:glycosyltransferase involved in cell wall biosynthesis